MIDKLTGKIVSRAPDIDQIYNEDKTTNVDLCFDPSKFNESYASNLLSVFNYSGEEDFTPLDEASDGGENGTDSKSASVKFMITNQEEKDLHSLGYSQEQIDSFKPQEAADILKALKKSDA